MSASQVILPRKFEASKFTVKDERKEMSHGSSSLSLSYDGANALVIQTPKMSAPFGIGDGPGNKEPGEKLMKYSMDLTFTGENDNSDDPKLQREAKRMKEFRKCMEDVNNKLIDVVYAHPEWIKCKTKKISRQDFIDEHFCNSIRGPNMENPKNVGKDYPDTFKCKIPFDNEKNDKPGYVQFTNSETKENVSWNDLYGTKYYHAICIVRITGAWLSPSTKKFGYFIKLAHMQFTPSPQQELTIQSYDSDDPESGSDSDNVESDDEIDDLE